MTIGSLDRPQVAPPTVRYGVESRLALFDRLAALPAKARANGAPREQFAKLVGYQHPDHETPADRAPRCGPRRD